MIGRANIEGFQTRNNTDEEKEDRRKVQVGKEDNEEVGGAVVPVTETTAESGGARHLLEQTKLRKAACGAPRVMCLACHLCVRVPRVLSDTAE